MKNRTRTKSKKSLEVSEPAQSVGAGFQFKDIVQNTEFAPSLLPLIKAELKLLLWNKSKWLWFLTIGGMAAMLFLPIEPSHQLVLPILWFLQIGMWSDLVSKDYALRTHYFTASAYEPIRRLFLSRILAASFIALVIAAPLLVRLFINVNLLGVINVVLGAFFIVLLAVLLGTLTKSKKLFEVLFFFIIYSNLNLISIADYYGGVHSSVGYTILLLVVNLVMFFVARMVRMNYEQ